MTLQSKKDSDAAKELLEEKPFQHSLYLCRSVLVLAATGISVSQSAITISLNVPAAFALLHRIGDGTLGVPARLDLCASLTSFSTIKFSRDLSRILANITIRSNASAGLLNHLRGDS